MKSEKKGESWGRLPLFAWHWGSSMFNFRKLKSQSFFQQLSHEKTYFYEKLTLRRDVTSFNEIDFKKIVKKNTTSTKTMKTINLFRFLKTYFGSLYISLLTQGITRYGVKAIKSTERNAKRQLIEGNTNMRYVS